MHEANVRNAVCEDFFELSRFVEFLLVKVVVCPRCFFWYTDFTVVALQHVAVTFKNGIMVLNYAHRWFMVRIGQFQVFSEVAYKAKTRSDLLAGIDEFLDQVTVLPPGAWDASVRIEPPKELPGNQVTHLNMMRETIGNV